MKIRFCDSDLAYPSPDKLAVEFVPETAFESDFLVKLGKLTKDLKFQFVHPCDQVGSNPFCVLQLRCSNKEVGR